MLNRTLTIVLTLVFLSVDGASDASSQTDPPGLKLRFHGGGGISSFGATGSLGGSLSGRSVSAGMRYLTSSNSFLGGDTRNFIGLHIGIVKRYARGSIGISAGVGRLSGEDELRIPGGCLLGCATETIATVTAFLFKGHALMFKNAIGLGIEPFIIISSHHPYPGITLNLYAGKF